MTVNKIQASRLLIPLLLAWLWPFALSAQDLSLEDTRDFSASEERVMSMYLAYYGRPADPGGLEFWTGELEAAGGNLTAILDAFGTSEEYTRRFGGLSNGQLIDNLYDQLFGREPDAGGRDFWLGELSSGRRSLQEIALSILEGAQNEDVAIIENRLALGKLYVSNLEQGRLEPLADTVLAETVAGIGASDASLDAAITDLEAAASGEQNGEFVAGEFQPAEQFADLCVDPRSGIDPDTGGPFPDAPGTVVDQNNFLRSWSNDLYLWYDEIVDRNPASFTTEDYFPLLKTFATTASGAPKDQFHFSQNTEQYRQQSQSGISAGFGATFVILAATPPRRIVVSYIEPNSPASQNGLARGAEVIEINNESVEFGNPAPLNAGLFPDVGETVPFTVIDRDSTTERSFSMTAEEITSDPVQNVGTIETESGLVGYLTFNDHIATAEGELKEAIETLAGVDDLILDMRYNGGGFLAIASQLAYMIAGPAQTAGRAFENLQFNDKHPTVNPVTGELLEPLSFLSFTVGLDVPCCQNLTSLNLSRVFVLTGPGTCSASESVMNALRGIDVEVIQIGATTCGKPFGFYPRDNCGTTYFSIQFQNINDKGFGDYADGFSPINESGAFGVDLPGCAVPDDFTKALGDPTEARLSAALTYRQTGSCPDTGVSARALTVGPPPLSAVDGQVVKPEWLKNRIMTVPGGVPFGGWPLAE